MLSRTLRSILSLSPKGRTTLQLVRLLERASIGSSLPEVLAALDEMRRRGQVTIDRGGHWQLRGQHARTHSSDASLPPDPEDHDVDYGAGRIFRAVRTRIRSLPDTAGDGTAENTADTIGTPPFNRLLAYYEATQKTDPRGPIALAPDRHEHQFQLIHGTENWWSPSSVIAIDLGKLPPTFRHALSKRNGDALVIGYPLATIVEDGECRIFPVGLISASLSRKGFVFEATPQSSDVIVNPCWISEVERAAAGKAKALAQQFDAAQSLAFDEFRERLSDCMAPQLSGPLVPDDLSGSIDPAKSGIHNAAAIIIPAQASFSEEVAADLGQLAQNSASQLAGTALWSLLHDNGAKETAGSVLNPVPLTPSQLEAAELAMTGAATAVTGPSGTGKTRLIVSVIASALAEEKTVLLVSPDRRSIDAVEKAMAGLSPGLPVLVRADGRGQDRDTDFMRIIADLDHNDAPAFDETIADELLQLRDRAVARTSAYRDRAAAQRLHCALSDHIERRAEILAKVGAGRPPTETLNTRLRRLVRFRPPPVADETLAPGAALDELDAAIERDQKSLAKITASEDPILQSEDIVARMKVLFPALVANALAVEAEDYRKLDAEKTELELWGRTNAREMTDHVALQVLACRPVWAVTTLSAPSRVPLAPGIFDYVIFDQANQCDIASALPLMARAKRLVVIGDRHQPKSIPGLGPVRDCALMDAAGLPSAGMERYAQSRNSLFEFCTGRPATRSVMLCEHFRSAPAIVDYLNDAYYGGRLQAACNTGELNAPAAAKPGIVWTDISGRISLDHAGQSRNPSEANAIVEHLGVLLGEQDYQGSIGVMTPFGAQATLLRQLIGKEIPRKLRENADIEIGTAERFQDGERDIILFSPVAGPGLCEGARAFLSHDKKRFNVAIGRTRAAVHVFGNLAFARECGIRHLAVLADNATDPDIAESPGADLDCAWEQRVDAALRARGLNPTPRYPTAGRYLDFALFGEGEIKLDLEVDGRRWHMNSSDRRKIDDMRRDYQLKNLGWRVRRFWVHELEQDMEGCLDQVERDLAG